MRRFLSPQQGNVTYRSRARKATGPYIERTTDTREMGRNGVYAADKAPEKFSLAAVPHGGSLTGAGGAA